MKEIFDLCVFILNYIASVTGLSYEAVNVWIFLLIEPAIFLFMACGWMATSMTVRSLKRRIEMINKFK